MAESGDVVRAETRERKLAGYLEQLARRESPISSGRSPESYPVMRGGEIAVKWSLLALVR